MSLDGNTILASLLVSSVGFVLMAYGKKMARAPQLITGVVMLVFPYFVGSALWVLGIGVGLPLLMWLLIARGL